MRKKNEIRSEMVYTYGDIKEGFEPLLHAIFGKPLKPSYIQGLRGAIAEVLGELSPREQTVIFHRFGLDGNKKTLEEVGKTFNIGKERVRQIEAKALRRLRLPKRSRRLREYLYEEELNIMSNLEELGLKPISLHALQRNNINSIEKLCTYTPEDVLSLRKVGTHCLQDIEATLAEKGLKLASPDILEIKKELKRVTLENQTLIGINEDLSEDKSSLLRENQLIKEERDKLQELLEAAGKSEDFMHLNEIAEEYREILRWSAELKLFFGTIKLFFSRGTLEAQIKLKEDRFTDKNGQKQLVSSDFYIGSKEMEALQEVAPAVIEALALREKLSALRLRLEPLVSVIKNASLIINPPERIT